MIPVWFARTLGVLLFLGGCALVGLNAYATWLQGSTWAVTDGGKFIAKSTAVTMEVVGVVLIGFAAGAAWSAGKRGTSVVLTVIMVISGIVVVNSIASFRATERMSASKTREAVIDRIKDADKLQAASADKAMKLAGGADTKSARRDFIGANRDAIKDFRSTPMEVRIDPDAGAEVWATALGYTIRRVQMWQSAMEAIWQVALSMVCFHFAGLFMNPLSWLTGSVASSPKAGSGGGGSGVKSTEESKDKQPAREAEIHRFPVKATAPPDQLQATPKVSSEPRVPMLAPRPSLPFYLKPEYASVADFLARHPSVTNQKVIADALGVSQAKVSRDIKKLKGQGRVKVKKNWRDNAVTFTPRRNGEVLHAVI